MSFSHYAAYFLTALVICLAATPLMGRLAHRVGAIDRDTGRRVHEGLVPRLGGGGIYLGFVLPMAWFWLRHPAIPGQRLLLGIVLAATLVFAIGIYDDLRGATVRNKLLVETAAALMLYAWGVRIEVVSSPFGGYWHLGWLALPATVLWVVVITNAINLIDGLDGLASGTGILIAAALFTFAPHQELYLGLSLCVLAGALVGFLRHNFPPATIFMGDSGSLLVGFLLSAFALLSSFKAAAVVTLLVPVMVFSHPLLDMAYAVLRRYFRGVPLASADRDHIHHRLLDMGFSRRTALAILVGVNLGALLLAAVAFHRGPRGDIAILVLMPVLGLLGLRLFGYVKSRTVLGRDIRVIRMDRHRRYLMYLIREFRDTLPSVRRGDELAAAITALLRKADLAATELHFVTAAGQWRVLRFGVVPGGVAMRLEYPVTYAGHPVGRVVLLAAGPDRLSCAPEIGAALAEAVCSLLFAEPGRTGGAEQ